MLISWHWVQRRVKQTWWRRKAEAQTGSFSQELRVKSTRVGCTPQWDLPKKDPALQMRLKKQLSGGRVPHLLQKAERRGELVQTYILGGITESWDVCVPVCVSWGQRATKDPAHARKTPSSVIHRQRRTSPQTTPHLCFNLWQLRCSFLNMNSYGFVALATVSPVSTGANGPNLIQHTKVKEGNCTASSIYQQTITGHTHTIHSHRGTLESLALTCMLVGGNQRSRKPEQNV